eukprot:g17914.t1
MVASRAADVWALLLGVLLLRLSPATGQPNAVEASEACADFAADPPHSGSPWTLYDCIKVWEHFRTSAPPRFYSRLPHVDLWWNTGVELRKQGTPCLVASKPTSDGVGSSTIRHLATWIYSEQMGCDWVTPDWGKRHVGQGNGTEVMYCHRAAAKQDLDPSMTSWQMQRCSVVDWLSYFQFNVPSVALPEGAKLKYVDEPRLRSADGISSLVEGLQNEGLSDAPWDRLVFTFDPMYASQILLSTGSWDEGKRQTVRKVLQQARTNFHRHPRPWYDEDPKCAFDQGRLNFALHVRLGDRRGFQEGNGEYFQLLEHIMDTIAVEVVQRGLQVPLFHVFSETLVPCPPEETGLFDEFPRWPVVVDKIQECFAAPTPEDCPEKRAGQFCSPTRDGVFKVVGKNIMLHVGPDVRNALSCMIHADGVLMGCSTFGQVAGLFSNGISMFSTGCDGAKTPVQYKSIPPLAVAERGHMWVPIAGSWRDPVLTSTGLFREALDNLLSERDAAV